MSWREPVLTDGHVVTKIKAIKEKDGPMLQVWGSGTLTQTLLKSDPIDALRLRTFPIAEGSGKRLGAEVTMPDSFELIKKKG